MKIHRADLGIAERFQHFRKKDISSSSITAAEELGISQPTISRIENGTFNIKSAIIKTMETKYNMNRSWLLDKVGQPIDKEGSKKTSLAKAMKLQDNVDALTTEVSILKKNLNRVSDIIERHQKAIDNLEKQKL